MNYLKPNKINNPIKQRIQDTIFAFWLWLSMPIKKTAIPIPQPIKTFVGSGVKNDKIMTNKMHPAPNMVRTPEKKSSIFLITFFVSIFFTCFLNSKYTIYNIKSQGKEVI